MYILARNAEGSTVFTLPQKPVYFLFMQIYFHVQMTILKASESTLEPTFRSPALVHAVLMYWTVTECT